jgi:hypothetical protein
MAVAIIPARTFAGAPATYISVTGPGLPAEGVNITGTWPGSVSFIDFGRGRVPEPALDLPRYVLRGYTANGKKWYTVLYVWDRPADRAVVYLPGGLEREYYEYGRRRPENAKPSGDWYLVKNQGEFEGWADLIRKALPQSVQDNP